MKTEIEYNLEATKRKWVPEWLFAIFSWPLDVVVHQPFRWIFTKEIEQVCLKARCQVLQNELGAIKTLIKSIGYPHSITMEDLAKYLKWTKGEIDRLREGEKRAEAYMAKLQAMIPIERRVELAKEMEGNWVALMARKG